MNQHHRRIFWLVACLCCPLEGVAQTAPEALKLLSASAFSDTGKRTVWQGDLTFFNDKESNAKFAEMLTSQAGASAADKAQQEAIAKSINDQLASQPLVRQEVVDIEFECHSIDKWKLRYAPRHMSPEAATILIADGSGSLLEVNEQNKTLVITPYSPAKLGTYLFGVPKYALQKAVAQSLEPSLVSPGQLKLVEPIGNVVSLLSFDQRTWEIRNMKQEIAGKLFTTWQFMPEGYRFEHLKPDGSVESKGVYKRVSETDVREFKTYRFKKGFSIILNRDGKQYQMKSDEFEGLVFDGMAFKDVSK